MTEGPAIWSDARLESTRFGPVHWFTSIDSTNRYLLDEAARGTPVGLVAVADEQSAGRGRLGRSWVAPPGASLLVSVLLRPDLPRDRWPLLTLAAGLAGIEAVDATTGVAAGLKWPNDLVVADRKLAGLLAEAAGDAVVVGMGCNVHWDELPPDIAETATATNIAGGRPVTREELLVHWLRGFDERLSGIDAVVREAEQQSATVGRRVRVELPNETFEATAVALDDRGCLVVERDDGTRSVVAAADVIHLRPA